MTNVYKVGEASGLRLRYDNLALGEGWLKGSARIGQPIMGYGPAGVACFTQLVLVLVSMTT